MKKNNLIFLIFLNLALASCSLFELTLEQEADINKHEEFENLITVKKIEDKPTPKEVSGSSENAESKIDKNKKEKATVAENTTSSIKKRKKTVKSNQKRNERMKMKEPSEQGKAQDKKQDQSQIKMSESAENKNQDEIGHEMKHEPEIEDGTGFLKRRPIKDPFVVGESVTLDLTYFKMEAGKLVFKVLPIIEVNGRKAYHFQVSIKSSKLFSMFYKLDNIAESYVDYETLRPFSHSVHLKESGQVKEARSFFDWEKKEANYWEKKITKDHGEESKKINWAIKDFSQNVISALFYFRTFTYKIGKELQFYVADDKKNIIFKGKALRKEKINTEAGELKTFVMKPEFIVDGAFKPVGDIYFWLTDDDRKLLVKIESKIKIGTIKAEVSKLIRGQ